MRPALATLATTLGPSLIGVRWIGGPLLLRCSLGALVGMVIVAFGALLGGLVGAVVPAVLLACLAGWLLGPRLRFEPSEELHAGRLAHGVTGFVLAVGGCLLVLAVFRPVPAWDGWMTWSLKAKALAVDGSFSGSVFNSSVYAYSHQDYPPLLPAWQALAYLIGGDLRVSWPSQFQLAWLWSAGAVALVNLVARRWGSGLLFLLPWLCAPPVIYWAMAGYADVPMALLLLTGTVVLLSSRPPQPAAVAGVLLAGCALMKNEGLPLAVLTAASLLVFSPHRPLPGKALGLVVAAALPWLLSTRIRGIPSDLVTAETLHPQRVLQLTPRLWPIAKAWASQLVGVRSWGLLVAGSVVAALIGWRPRRDLLVAFVSSVALLTGIYVITPYNVSQQLTVSIDRVTIAPLGLLALMMAAAQPPRSAAVRPPSPADADSYPRASSAGRSSSLGDRSRSSSARRRSSSSAR
jgi:hypothetical protein